MTVAREFTEEELTQVEELSANGVPQDGIAALLGTTRRTLHRRRQDDEALDLALRRGLAKQCQALVGSLFARAMDKSDKSGAICAMFLLKSVHGFRDQGPSTDEKQQISVNILNLPRPLSEDEYKALAQRHPAALTASSEPDDSGEGEQTDE